MNPTSAPVTRTRMHTREIRIEGFQRSDGLWDIEGRLSDVKDHDFRNVVGEMPAGQPIHDMWLRITVDEHLAIHGVEAGMDAVPYRGHCERVAPDYGKLAGLTIGAGFRKAATGALGGLKGCTHVTDLLWMVATAAIQTLAPHRLARWDPAQKPFQLDGCHAWDTSGPLVKRYYPRWFREDMPEVL